MMQHKNKQDQADLNRRSFLKNSSFATFAALMGGIPLHAAESSDAEQPTTQSSAAPPLNFGVIGCGAQGREIIKTLTSMPNAPVVALCDTYGAFVRRTKRMVPDAQTYENYQELLANQDVQGVVVATPTHLHKDIVIDALKAGKHVYCEMPMAHSIDDARVIAKAAQSAYKLNFQAGLAYRSDPQHHHVWKHIRRGGAGKIAQVRAQWHKKNSWRRSSASTEQEQLLNWRLDKTTSTGLMGEIGIHQLDMVTFFMDAKPVSVTGFSSLIAWTDGRDVPDTVQTVFEYPEGVRLCFDITLANSYESEYIAYYGTDGAIVMRENKAWLFKEVDAPLLGWEVYAPKDAFYKETGIVMMANASKLGTKVAETGELPPTEAPLYKSLESFVTNTGMYRNAVEDFTNLFGDDEKGMRDYLPTAMEAKRPAADAQTGFDATVTAIKANEAILAGEKLVFKPEWYQL